MAWKYRKEYHEAGDALIPEDWLENQKEFVEEFNGYLDRDNFREKAFSGGAYNNTATPTAINSMPVVYNNTFNAVFADAHTTWNGTSYGQIKLLDLGGDSTSVGWASTGSARPAAYSSFNTMPSLSLDLDDDSLLIVEFSGSFKWMGRSEVNNNGEHIRTSLGTGLWEGIYSPTWGDGESHLWDVYIPDNNPDDLLEPRRMFACIKFRILVAGDVVAESGWFANHVERNSVYLVGAVPVLSGKNEVSIQYKMAYVDNRNASESVERNGVLQPCTMFERELIVHQRKR
tara:strand:- start:606 stop:1466 length:861 start_codon:yes stop_codon:yes gene_type:complete